MILIIEDDSTINSLLCGILKKSGYEVESCTDGLNGYNMALDKDYQLILMDLMLPMKSGEEILRALREVKKTPVIVLSAKNDVHNRIELLRLGADDFICKPFDIDEVILRIEAVLRRVEDESRKGCSWRREVRNLPCVQVVVREVFAGTR